MCRIRIEDLPKDLCFSEKEMNALIGGAKYVLYRRNAFPYFCGAMLSVRDFMEEQSYYPSQK